MSTLFKQYKLNDIELSNRIVMAPMTRSRANNNGQAVDIMATYYGQRASAGLIITEGVFINEMAMGYINVPKIQTPAHVESWKPVADKVHANGGKIFMQIWHVGAASHPTLLDGKLPLSPSGVNPNIKVYSNGGFIDTVEPKAMTLDEISTTIKDFGIAAKNAIDAGMDGIEIHGANGYLVNQFFQKNTNKRNDSYGGSIENRARFLFDILDEIKKHIPIEKVGIRFSPIVDGFGVEFDDETEALYQHIAKKIDTEYKVAYIHANGIISPSVKSTQDQVRQVAQNIRKHFKGNLIINTGLTKEFAETLLNEGTADLFAFGMPFIANPNLVEKFKNNIELSTPNFDFLYAGGAEGYTDY